MAEPTKTRQALIEAGVLVPASVTVRRLPKVRVVMAPGDSIADLVAQQRR